MNRKIRYEIKKKKNRNRKKYIKLTVTVGCCLQLCTNTINANKRRWLLVLAPTRADSNWWIWFPSKTETFRPPNTRFLSLFSFTREWFGCNVFFFLFTLLRCVLVSILFPASIYFVWFLQYVGGNVIEHFLYVFLRVFFWRNI